MDLRDRAAGAGLGLAFAVALAVPAVAIAESWGGGYWVFGCATGLVLAALALARGHNRGWLAAAGLAVTAAAVGIAHLARLPAEPGPATALGLSVLLGSALRTLPARWAVALATGGFALVVATALTTTAAMTFSLAGWLAGVGTGLGLRLLDARRRTAAERVRRAERLELARELHDVVAHHITGVVLHAQAARVVRRKYPEKLEDSLTGIETAGAEALAAMRRVVGVLRAPATPGPEQLSDLIARFRGPAVRLHLPEGAPDWPPEITSTVYRIVREALTNTTRHAPQARSVTVSITEGAGAITVEVVDEAPASRHPRRGGYGLIGMRERVQALGGTLAAGPAGSGWSVRAVLPLPAGVRR